MLIGFYWLTMTANRSNNISVFIQYSPYPPPWRNNNENCRPGLDIQLRLISGQFSELHRLLVGQCDHFFANLVQHNSVTWPSIGQQTIETTFADESASLHINAFTMSIVLLALSNIPYYTLLVCCWMQKITDIAHRVINLWQDLKRANKSPVGRRTNGYPSNSINYLVPLSPSAQSCTQLYD